MKTNIIPLEPETYYHIYNRGINGEDIFKERFNYDYFLQKYAKYVSPVADTYSYCLLKNHFHVLIRTHSEEVIRNSIKKDKAQKKEEEKPTHWILANAFASLFKSYAQAINKGHQRTGRLFEQPFRRVEVNSENYFTEMIYYIHLNPQRHGFVDDFRDYAHSSYQSLLLTAPTKLKRDEVLEWFGGREAFEKFHLGYRNLDDFKKIEEDDF